MKPMAKIRNKLQRGFSLVTAIFLVVVLSALGAMMVTFFTAQQQSSTLDVLGSRAYQAARAGVEWAALGVSASSSVPWSGCATGPVPPLSLGGTLAPFSVSVACSAISAVEGTSTIWVYDITSTASGVNGAQPGQPDYVERVINVKIGK